MRVFYKRKRVYIDINETNLLTRITGLMFRTSDTENLLFSFSNNTRMSLHSYFVFFPFLVLWLDGKNKVLDFRIVKPFLFSIKTSKKFRKIVEIPVSEKNREIIEFFVGKGKV